MTEKELYKKAIDKWGIRAQYDMIIEECLELALILQQAKRYIKAIPQKAIINELADVEIMLRQARVIFPEAEIDRAVKHKLERLEKLLNKRRLTCSDKQ